MLLRLLWALRTTSVAFPLGVGEKNDDFRHEPRNFYLVTAGTCLRFTVFGQKEEIFLCSPQIMASIVLTYLFC